MAAVYLFRNQNKFQSLLALISYDFDADFFLYGEIHKCYLPMLCFVYIYI